MTIEILGHVPANFSYILSPTAVQFLAELHKNFDSIRLELLQLRRDRQVALDSGNDPDFLEDTEEVRRGDWKCCSTPQDLLDRRVEITGPVDRKLIINALNSSAKVFMADFEDSTCPTWENLIDGQHNLYDAVRKTITFESPDGKKKYRLKEKIATLMVRPRGWHLDEGHVLMGGRPMSASLFDFGLFFFHNAQYLIDHGTGPYFYLPKMESYLEARLWNDVFSFSQSYCCIPQGSIRATVLIETILAAFEMDEILYELRDHSAGLNCGRWDYIFSFIKKFRHRQDRVLPDRDLVTMTRPFMANYVELLIQTCHRRGVHAMGGMAAQIPIHDDKKANDAAMEKVVADKKREVVAGHDGTWVAHPALIPLAMKVFNEHMKTPNQISKKRNDRLITGKDLLDLGEKLPITEPGLRVNISVGLRYVEAWLRGIGCVPLLHKMEDAATAEISRSQIWHWIRHTCRTKDGKEVSREWVQRLLNEEVDRAREEFGSSLGNKNKLDLAKKIYAKLMFAENLPDFLTTEAYPHIITRGTKSSI